MAGVGLNRKVPNKKFVFRYHYLLTKVGAAVLRKVFDHIVGPDLKVYLDNNPDRKRDFNKLLSSRNILTLQQLQFLPPIDNSPSSDNFDINTLTILLRNVCGLLPPSDQVWFNPQPTDRRVEAYITRLRHCRNELAHSESVLEDETVLTTKWNKLCMILQGLAGYCEFGNLQEKIDIANSIDIDDRQKEKLEKEKENRLREIYEILQRRCSSCGSTILQTQPNLLSEDKIRQEYENRLKCLEKRSKEVEDEINKDKSIQIDYQQRQQKSENRIKELEEEIQKAKSIQTDYQQQSENRIKKLEEEINNAKSIQIDYQQQQKQLENRIKELEDTIDDLNLEMGDLK